MRNNMLWRSDLWSFTLLFALMTLLLVVAAAAHLARGETGQAFGAAFAALLPLVCTVVCACNNSASLRRASGDS